MLFSFAFPFICFSNWEGNEKKTAICFCSAIFISFVSFGELWVWYANYIDMVLVKVVRKDVNASDVTADIVLDKVEWPNKIGVSDPK